VRRVIRIVGAPASGKSTLRRALAAALQLPSFSIDDERLRLMGPGDVWPADDRQAWLRLRAAVELHPVAIVETSGSSTMDALVYEGTERFTILCVADAAIRRRRLIARVAARHPLARTPQYVERVSRQGEPVGLSVQAVWHGDRTASIEPLVARIGAWLSPAAMAV
jgi:predicted kinase